MVKKKKKKKKKEKEKKNKSTRKYRITSRLVLIELFGRE